MVVRVTGLGCRSRVHLMSEHGRQRVIGRVEVSALTVAIEPD